MKVLIACEYSGKVRDAFRAKGHDAISCDLLPTERPGNHYRGNVFDIINGGFDLLIAHPPCTFLTNAGVRWLYTDPERWRKMEAGAKFFRRLLKCRIPRIAIENPIMHKYAVGIIGRRQNQVIQPWMFGHPESKATCLWLKGLPPLRSTKDVKAKMLLLPKPESQKIFYMSPGKQRSKLRSETYQGIADAMAEQWSE